MSIEGLKFFVEGDVPPPQRNKGDAGIDFFVPRISDKFIKDLTEKNHGHPHNWGLVGAPAGENSDDNENVLIYVAPHCDLLIPTYIRALIPENVFLKVTNKSGVCTKQKFIHGADTIDSTYEGVIHIHVFNNSPNNRFIGFGQKLVQIVPIIYDPSEIEIFYDENNEAFKNFDNQITKDKFYKNHFSERKEGSFGSTSLKE